jgi:hypothetical protein
VAPFRRNHREEEAGTCRDDAALKPGAAASARAPDLPSRVDLTRIGERQLDQIRSLQRQLQRAQFDSSSSCAREAITRRWRPLRPKLSRRLPACRMMLSVCDWISRPGCASVGAREVFRHTGL